MARMRYSQAQFFKLMDLVTDQGGRHLDRPHAPVQTKWTGKLRKTEKIVYCGQDTLFAVPYLDRGGTTREAVMCALCDRMGNMPRFATAMEAQ